jgi:hypothetical protein
MEDPITFDLWVVATAVSRERTEEMMRSAQPELGPLKAKQAIARSLSAGEPILFIHQATWAVASEWRTKLRELLTEVDVYQAGYGPADLSRLRFCEIHQVHYAGIFGCPVCDGRSA